MSGAEEAPIYPQYCFHLSPTISKWCPLKAADIERLTTHPGFGGQDLFFHINHPIKWVRITGVIVAVDEYAQRRVYTVDDSSGVCIECVVIVTPTPQLPEKEKIDQKEAKTGASAATKDSESAAPETFIPDGLDVGNIVDIKGGLKVFRAQKQIKVEKIVRLNTTEQEVTFWNKITQFRNDVLSHPWHLERKEIRKCRKEAEGIDEAKERRAQARRLVERESRVSRERQDKSRAAPSKPTRVEKRAKATKILSSLKGKYDALGI